MKVIVSACLLGRNCKYNGSNNKNASLIDVLAAHPEVAIVPVCPEVAGGLPTPRPPAEIVGGEVMTVDGVSVDAEFRLGCRRIIEQLEGALDAGEISGAVLQSRSPSCGVDQVYDGTFSGTLVDGRGLFAQALLERGVPICDVSDLETCAQLFDS